MTGRNCSEIIFFVQICVIQKLIELRARRICDCDSLLAPTSSVLIGWGARNRASTANTQKRKCFVHSWKEVSVWKSETKNYIEINCERWAITVESELDLAVILLRFTRRRRPWRRDLPGRGRTRTQNGTGDPRSQLWEKTKEYKSMIRLLLYYIMLYIIYYNI